MVKVYFEKKLHATIVAYIPNEEIYIRLIPILESIASEEGCILTESIIK